MPLFPTSVMNEMTMVNCYGDRKTVLELAGE